MISYKYPALKYLKYGQHLMSLSRLQIVLVQAFYHEKWVNLPLIAKEGFLRGFGPGTSPSY